MKTLKRHIVMIVMAAALALPAVAVDYGYKSQYAVMPPAEFHSTSTMVATGSAYSSNPTIGDDGTATYGGSSGPSRRRAPDPLGTEDDMNTNPGGSGMEIPIGDAALPMMLMIGGYVVWRARRRKVAANMRQE